MLLSMSENTKGKGAAWIREMAAYAETLGPLPFHIAPGEVRPDGGIWLTPFQFAVNGILSVTEDQAIRAATYGWKIHSVMGAPDWTVWIWRP